MSANVSAVVNDNAIGTWKQHIGRQVTVHGYETNGRAALLSFDGESRRRWVPTRWLDITKPETPRRRLRTMRSVIA